MTPKQKAKDLIGKFEDQNLFFESNILEQAKEFAIVCVDEILEHAQMIETSYEGYKNPYEYLIRVKHEIILFNYD